MSVKYDSYGEEVECLSLVVTKYAGGNMAVLANLKWPDGEIDQSKVSVNLDHGQATQSKDLPKGEFFADINESKMPLYVALKVAGWLEATGTMARSGFLKYPSVRLTDKAVIGGAEE